MILISWQNILKQKFNFDSLNFKVDRNGNWNAVYDFGEGVRFSILAGKGAYSTPREYLDNPMDYRQYEVMLRFPGLKSPQDIGIQENDDVFGYLTKEKVTEYARLVEENLPTKRKKKKQKDNLRRLVDAFKE